MAQRERLDKILKIVDESGFIVASKLIEQLHYSSATVYRDLNELEKLGLIKRKHGGVESLNRGWMKTPQRYGYMKPEKRKLAEEAAAHIENGDAVFIGAGTTTYYMIPFLAEKKDIHIITHDLYLTEHLSEMGIKTTCLGGQIQDPPWILLGTDTIENAAKHRASKLFFSATGITEDGHISVIEPYYMLDRVMMDRSKQIYLLADHSKLNREAERWLCDFSSVDFVISDIEFPEKTLEKFPQTQFILTRVSENNDFCHNTDQYKTIGGTS